MKLNQSHSRSSSTLLGVLLLAVMTYAQADRPTIPEILARAGESTSGMRMVGSGPPPTISDILKEPTRWLRSGRKPRSYLSDDQQEVYTDYPILNPSFVYQSVVVTSTKPGMPTVTVTLPGGSITINGLTYTFKDLGLPHLSRAWRGCSC